MKIALAWLSSVSDYVEMEAKPDNSVMGNSTNATYKYKKHPMKMINKRHVFYEKRGDTYKTSFEQPYAASMVCNLKCLPCVVYYDGLEMQTAIQNLHINLIFHVIRIPC